jgi:hypothetical protein
LGLAWALDIDILDTLRGEIIGIPSSSSYELSLFSSMADIVPDTGGGVAPGELSSSSIGDLWPKINSREGATATTTCSSLEASLSHRLPSEEARKRALIGLEARRDITALEQASC